MSKSTLNSTMKSILAVCYSRAEACIRLNSTGPVVNMIMWSGIEACASTICANLPCYGPLLRKIPSARFIAASIRAVFTSARGLFTSRSVKKSLYLETTSTENFASKGGVSSEKIGHEPDIELGQMKV